jgi:hypothetical protein
MDAFAFIAIYVLMLAVPAALITAVVGGLLRFSRFERSSRMALIIIAGSIMPGQWCVTVWYAHGLGHGVDQTCYTI